MDGFDLFLMRSCDNIVSRETTRGLRTILFVVAVVLLVAGLCQAAPVKSRAAAAVAVARVRVQLARSVPELPDRVRGAARGAVPAQSAEPVVSPADYQAAQDKVAALSKELEGLGESHREVTVAKSALVDQLDSLTDERDSLKRQLDGDRNRMASSFETSQPMKFVFDAPSAAAPGMTPTNELRAQLELRTWPRGCPAGDRLRADVMTALRPLGWVIGRDPSCQIWLTDGDAKTEGCPIVILRQSGVEIQRWTEYTQTSVLSTALRKAWDEAPEKTNFVASRGSAGAIEASQQIRSAMEFFRKYVGDGVQVNVSWDRSGSQSIPLMAKKDWTFQQILGATGHVSIDARGAVGLPCELGGFGYKLRGEDIAIDADEIVLQGMLRKLKGAQSGGPAGIFVVDDVVAYWGIYSALRGLYSLLMPSVDLTLPGQLSWSMCLNADVLTVEFTQPPVVKIVELFTFNLAIKRVTITERNIHVQFTGSRLVQSRDFAVR